MQKVSIDLFQANGCNYVVMVDRYSGYPFVAPLQKTSTEAMLKHIRNWFNTFGYPSSLRTDGGPQFRGEFKRFCEEKGIIHEQSSPYHPQSNGHAEAAVKNIKYLIMKVKPQEFESAFSKWKNTARHDCPSPNELFLRRRVRLDLPITESFLRCPVSDCATNIKTRDTEENDNFQMDVSADSEAEEKNEFQVGVPVWVQDPITNRWTIKASVEAISHTGRTLSLALDTGGTITRNRRLVRVRHV